MAVNPPSPPVVGGHPAKNSGTDNKPITRIVIHSAVMPCKPGMARRLGEMNRDGIGGGSWHYAVDPDETIQCSYDSYVCWHAPPNANSIGIEMADWPVKVPTTRAKLLAAIKVWRWNKPEQQRMLRRTAVLTARLCAAYDVPPTFRYAYGLRKGRKGVTTHAQVSLAFGQSTHWDPGLWPRRKFMRMVKAEYARITGETK